jgi:hypothetical protein
MQINVLHAPAPLFKEAANTEPMHMSGRTKKLRERNPASAAAAAEQEEVARAAERAAASAQGSGGLGMEWLCVLWQRALQHPNIQVWHGEIMS